MKHFSTFLILIGMTGGMNLWAKPIPRLQRMVEAQINNTSEALEGAEDPGVNSAAANAWKLQNIYLRLEALVGFKIFLFGNLTIVPNVELVWHKLEP